MTHKRTMTSTCLLALASVATSVGVGAAPVCNVMDHGAKGDGVSEDTAAIAAAVRACSGGGGGTVLLPEGGRFLSYPFNLTTNIHLAVRGVLLGPSVPDLARWPVLPHFPSYELSRSGHWTRFAPLVVRTSTRTLGRSPTHPP